ncbi:MAG: VTT domain-containing protein [Phycisphaerales bacterium]
MNEQESPTSSQSDRQPDQSLGATIKRLGPAAYLGIAWSITPAIAGFVLLANMKPASDFLLQKNQEGGGSLAIGLAMYIGIFILSAGFGFLPTYSQAILAGFAFGITMGFPAALIGFTGASVIGYTIAKIVARKSVESELHNHPKAEIVRDAFVKHGYWRAMGILILLRISPASPFSLMNGLMSVSGVKLLPYVLATAIGMAPRTFAAVWIGNQITSWDEYNKPKWLVIAGIVLMVVVIMILGQMANKAIDKAMGTNPAANPAANPSTSTDDTQSDSTSNPAE